MCVKQSFIVSNSVKCTEGSYRRFGVSGRASFRLNRRAVSINRTMLHNGTSSSGCSGASGHGRVGRGGCSSGSACRSHDMCVCM